MTPTQMKLNETRLVILLCILAGIRVLIFTAAFPFFNIVDESAHFDMIYRYSTGNIPTRLLPYSMECAHMKAFYGTREYYTDWYDFSPEESARPSWTLSPEEIAEPYKQATEAMTGMTDHESTQFSLYYLAEGGWYNIGKAVGLRGGMLLYWLRIPNIPIYMLLVWIGYLMARKLYPGNRWLNLGVPAMLAGFPQDIFFGLNPDVLSALLTTLSLYLILVYYLENRSAVFCISAGLSVAAAFLAKTSNLPLLLFFGVILVAKALKSRDVPRLASIFLAAAIPIGAWMVRNKLVLGDFMGTHAKIVRLSWTVKPLSEWFHHPVFTPQGAAYFWGGLIKTFWRGENIWHRVQIGSALSDTFYILTTLAFLAAAGIVVWKQRKERLMGTLHFLMLGLSAAFVFILMIAYDFEGCAYPSKDLPFLTSGRLILGALVPFLMLYLIGLGAILDRLKIGRYRWVALALILAIALGSGILLTRNVFASPYNFYHMLGNQ